MDIFRKKIFTFFYIATFCWLSISPVRHNYITVFRLCCLLKYSSISCHFYPFYLWAEGYLHSHLVKQ